MDPITFVVPGEEQAAVGAERGEPPLPAGLRQGRLKHSARVGAGRGGGEELRLDAGPGEDVVVLHIGDGPALVLHPEAARELILAQGEVQRTRGAGEPAPNEVIVPAELRWDGLGPGISAPGVARGALGKVLLSAVEVVTGLLKEPAARLVASKVVQA